MKKYNVIIDLSSTNLEIEANNEEEAKEKAIKIFETNVQNGKNPMADEYWIAECDEVKDEN